MLSANEWGDERSGLALQVAQPLVVASLACGFRHNLGRSADHSLTSRALSPGGGLNRCVMTLPFGALPVGGCERKSTGPSHFGMTCSPLVRPVRPQNTQVMRTT